jgi:hypothetical protein
MASDDKSLAKRSLRRWAHWCLTLGSAIALGVLGLPFARSNPELVHNYAAGLIVWQRHLLLFSVFVGTTLALCKLFAPRFSHLLHVFSHPPLWLAWLLGIAVVSVADALIGLSPGVYQATALDWWLCCAGSISAVFICKIGGSASDQENSTGTSTDGRDLALNPADHQALKSWLRTDAPAECDFLGHYSVAMRIKNLISSGIRSVGIVGPFGAGKTSIIEWLENSVCRGEHAEDPQLLVSRHSCWGFDDSASAIHAMLADGLSQVGRQIDTFHISSLPEAYQQSISSAGDWVNGLTRLIFRQRDPMEQFEALSDVLREIGARLVFVVEDLDRNNSRNFDLQEVLAFLQRLKDFPQLSFILTGGLASSRLIDFAKLCDHIEYLKQVSVSVASALIENLYEHAHDPTYYPHISQNTREDALEWGKWSGLLLPDREEYSLPQATSALLNTPRAIRHALARTDSAWQSLHGEINWNDLFAVNALRFAAPEAFQFLLRRWDRLHQVPSRGTGHDEGQISEIRKAVLADWEQITREVEWSPAAARTVITFVLPAAEWWLVNERYWNWNSQRRQTVEHERYWRRAVSELCAADEVRDQRVLGDLQEWVDEPKASADLVSGICSGEAYCEVWEYFAVAYLAEHPDRVYLLNQQVLARIAQIHGASASQENPGFHAVWRACQRLERRPENRKWLEDRISEASGTSLELLNAIWHFYGTPGQYSILRDEDSDQVRSFVVKLLRNALRTAEDLERVVTINRHWTLSQLVFDGGNARPTAVGLDSWAWLGPILLQGLRRESTVIAIETARLLSSRRGDAGRLVVDDKSLFGFFPNDAREVADLLGKNAISIKDTDDRELVKGIGESAKHAAAMRRKRAKDGKQQGS